MTLPAERSSFLEIARLVGRGAGKMGERNTNLVGTEAPHGKYMDRGGNCEGFHPRSVA